MGSALVSPPVALALDVLARSLAEVGRADDEDLQALRPGLIASPRTGWDAHSVPFPELNDLVVDLHPAAPAQDHVHLLLLLVRVAVRKAIAGRDALVAQAGFLELERLGRHAELQVRRAVELGPEILQVVLEVPESERHGAILWRGAAKVTSRFSSPGGLISRTSKMMVMAKTPSLNATNRMVPRRTEGDARRPVKGRAPRR